MSYITIYDGMTMKTIAYLRISTDQQDLDNQKLEIQTYSKQRNMIIDEFIEIEISSRKNGHDRKIDELLSKLKRHDCLVVSEISRLARSIREVHNIMHLLAKKKVELHAIKQNLITRGMNDMSTKILVNSFAMCAEIERDLISARTKNGLALAKSRGVKLGNPNIGKINKNRKKAADKYAETLRGVLTAFVEQGLSQRAIVNELNKAGIKTRQNVNEWSLIQLQNVLKRLGLQTKHTRG